MEPASIMGASSWIWLLILPFLAWLLLTQIRYMFGQYKSVGWPVIDATIQNGPTGVVPIGSGRGQGTPAWFVGYTFRLNSSTYTGIFALYGTEEDVESVRKHFSGGSIRIRYDPANPSVSYLNKLNDPRFGRLAPTQNPQHLAQAPSFDLQDIMRG